MIRWALVACALTACVSIPDYRPADGVSVTIAGTGGNVVGRGFALHFATEDAFPFPDSLTVDGTDILGHATSNLPCAEIDGVGFALKPMGRVASPATLPASATTWIPLMDGPAVAKIEVTWSSNFSCEPSRAPGGTTVFTVFPDGQIIRHDDIRDDVTTEINPTLCSCDTNVTTFELDTMWTFNSTLFTTVKGLGLPERPLPTASDQDITNNEVACIEGPMHHVAVSQLITTLRAPTASTFSFLHNYTGEGPVRLNEFAFESHSTVVVDTSCAAAILRADTALTPPMLSINDDRIRPSEIDGIYGGEVEHASGYALSDDHVELEGPVLGSFAVQLRFTRDVDALGVEKNGSAVAYIPQRIEGDTWLMWFEQGLGLNDTITIDPR